MSESSITPLAQRLAEENNVDWESLQGSGPEGRIIERDVLEYLARVMAGEEDLNPTPEPLPDGLDSWDSFEAEQETDTWFRPPESAAAEAVPVEAAADGPVTGTAVTEPAVDQFAAPEAEFELSDDIFLFDEDEADETALQLPTDSPAADGPELLLDEDSFDLFGDAGSTAAGPFAATDDADGLLDDDYYEDDFLTDLALEDGELDSPETADVDLTGFGMLGDTFGIPAAASHETDLLSGSFSDESAFLDERDDDIWATGAAVGSTAGRQEEAAPDSVRHNLAHYLQHETPAETAETGNHGLQFSLGEAEDDAEQDLLTGYTGLSQTEEARSGEDGFEVDFSELGSPTQAEAETGHDPDQPAAMPLPAEPLPAEPLPSEPLPAGFPPTALPLVSHGALLRRHTDLTLLAQARQAAGAELRQGEPASALPFLLRAAARSAHLLGGAPQGTGAAVTGAAQITEHGVRMQLVSDAAQGSFAELIRLLAPSPGDSGTEWSGAEASGAAVIACDVSELQLDEAVLHLGSPLLTLGRILSDSEQGTYHSTLTLSGTFDVEAGARFLQAVSELLASPVRLLI